MNYENYEISFHESSAGIEPLLRRNMAWHEIYLQISISIDNFELWNGGNLSFIQNFFDVEDSSPSQRPVRAFRCLLLQLP